MRSGISGPRHRGTLLLVVLSCLSDTARAMSQENVETVRRTYTAFNDGDLGTVLEIFDPNIEWNASDVFFDQPRTYRGRRTWQEEFLRDLMQLFEDYRGEPEEIRDGGDRVVAVVQVGGTGRRSGAKAMARVAHVLTFRDGKIVRFTEFKDVREAFEAAGLSEQDAQADS